MRSLDSNASREKANVISAVRNKNIHKHVQFSDATPERLALTADAGRTKCSSVDTAQRMFMPDSKDKCTMESRANLPTTISPRRPNLPFEENMSSVLYDASNHGTVNQVPTHPRYLL